MFAGSRQSRVTLAVVVLAASLTAFPPGARANFPGANGQIAFVRVPNTAYDPASPDYLKGDVFLANPDGTNPRKISAAPRRYSGIDWSADGSKVAFEVAVGEPTSGNAEIWVMNADGTEERRVSPAGVSRHNPSWSPDGRYLAVDDGGSIYRIDTEAGHEQLLRAPDETTVSCLGNEDVYPVYFMQPSWSPEGARIAVIRWHELPPSEAMDTCDPTPFFKFDLGVMPAGGGDVTLLTDDPATIRGSRFDALPDWSPDGSKIVFQRGALYNSEIGIATIPSGGGATTRLTIFGARPRWAPDGSKILFTRDEDEDGRADVWNMDSADGSNLTAVLQTNQANLFQDWQPTTAGELEVTLNAFGPDGTSLLDDVVGMSQTVLVELTIKNPGDEDVSGFTFAGDAPLVIDERSTGGLEITDQPVIDPNLMLEPDEEVTFAFDVTATANGIAAAHSKVTATDSDGRQLQDVHSLKFDIQDGAAMTDAMGQFVILQAMDQLLMKSLRSLQAGLAARGAELHRRLSAILTPAQRLRWFGSETELPLTPRDFAMALLRGSAAEMVAASFPKRPVGGYSIKQLDNAYNQSFKEEAGKGISEWAEGWASLGRSAKRGLEDSYREALLTSFVLLGTATPEERMEINAFMYNAATGTDASVDSLVNTVAREIPNWKENLTYLDEALDMAAADAILQSPDLQAQMAAETEWRANVLATAQTNPLQFQQAWAKRDAEIFNLAMPLILETLIGGAVTRVDVGARNIVVRGRGAAVLRAGEAMGALDDAGRVSTRPLKVKPTSSSGPAGATAGETTLMERSGSYLDDVEGATIIQSSDAGHVYELPNLGGVPEVTIDAKAGILADLEGDYVRAVAEGRLPPGAAAEVKLVEVLKPSSALRKANGIGKLELTPQKTGKPAMLDAGAPPEVLAEASVWRNTTHPADAPGFSNLSKARQEAAVAEWRQANQNWEEWLNPPAGSKTARLQQCIGRRSRVPLDTQPNASGIQRFVTAEFEEEVVRQGTAEARLIRAKYYKIETVDTRNGNRVVNSKVVVDSAEALPQGPDADAIGLGKKVGETPDGIPIVEPLSRAEREFFAQRYIDKNIKARKKPAGSPGAIPDAAEHGTTLIMDDASAQAAGKLLPSYGIPFLPENVGRQVMRRIAPFVAKIPPGTSPAQAARIIQAQYKQMLHAVRSQGGFGQHAIIVTSDSRHLAAVPFASW